MILNISSDISFNTKFFLIVFQKIVCSLFYYKYNLYLCSCNPPNMADHYISEGVHRSDVSTTLFSYVATIERTNPFVQVLTDHNIIIVTKNKIRKE